MLISRINIAGKKRWIEKAGNKYYLLNGDPYKSNLTRQPNSEFMNQMDVKFVNHYKPISVFGLAFNYKSLVGKKLEKQDPLIFFKSVNSISYTPESFDFPNEYSKIWVECELVIVIKKDCKNISLEKAKDYILGYTMGSDMTGENKYGRDHHLAFSKGADNFAPIFNWVNTSPPKQLKMTTKINNKIFQVDYTSNRLWNDYKAVSELSKRFTLKAGDLIFTGTPAGAMDSLINKGDKVEHFIQNIGKLKFNIK
ncbi:MAG: fumarylacetoacetate hydrolase family protein [Melioribacteraceae bacterium]|nr:fumarylacetoacetate hydrolase family protein [Melioribacteraceae bacterium]